MRIRFLQRLCCQSHGSCFLDSSLSHPNDRSQRHWSSLNKHGNLRKCSNLRINKNQKKNLSLMKESSKEALQITKLERHFYYWNLTYDYCLIFIIWVLLYRNEEQCWDLWATLLNCQDCEDSNKQTTLPTSKYVGKTEIQNSVEGQKTCQNKSRSLMNFSSLVHQTWSNHPKFSSNRRWN